MKGTKYYIIAGEASGDMHAANMMLALKKLDASAYFRVWGGDRMAEQAQEMAKHIRETSFMGIFGVLANLKTIKRNFRFCESDIDAFLPDVLILIDNSGFNLRIAKYVKNKHPNIRIHYYILPQAWAWKRRRVHTIHRYCDRVFATLPFEKEFYRSYGYDVDFVGHPIMDAMALKAMSLLDLDAFLKKNKLKAHSIVALLPGSRKREIKTKLPKMLKMVKHFPDKTFVVAGSTSVEESLYQVADEQGVTVLFEQTYDLLKHADVALVTSGTATLETALFNVPQVVCYQPGFVTFHLMKHIISIRFICMVNIILDKLAVTELIQGDLNEKRLKLELQILFSEERRTKMREDYALLKEKLGGTGASQRVAELIFDDVCGIKKRAQG